MIKGAVARPDPSQVRHYKIGGVGLTVWGGAAPIAALDTRLTRFDTRDVVYADATFQFDPVENVEAHAVRRPSGDVRPVYDPERGEVLYDDDTDLLYLAYGDRIRVVCDPIRGRTRVSVVQPSAADQWLLSHPMIGFPLIETLKRHGLYSVHAAGLTRNTRGLLVAGGSGSGKTTLAVALARAGFGFLGDDMLFLSTQGGDLTVRSFPDEVDVTDSTAAFFPELWPLLDCPPRPGWPKRSFRFDSVYGRSPVAACVPAGVVFPRVAHVERSSLEPMPSHEALLELAPNVLLTESRACQEHLDALARLTAETPCYRLATGNDFDALPALLGALLE